MGHSSTRGLVRIHKREVPSLELRWVEVMPLQSGWWLGQALPGWRSGLGSWLVMACLWGQVSTFGRRWA